MKNKHLVLLFLITLLVGLAMRRAPWRNSAFFQTKLLKIDPSEVQEIHITLPASPVISYLRGDAGWSAEQGDRSVNIPTLDIDRMLVALTDLRSIRILKTKQADTLGFIPSKIIQLSLTHGENEIETLEIGKEIMLNNEPATYIQLTRHEGIYLVKNHLRKVFSRTLKDFRNQTIALFDPSNVKDFTIFRQDIDSLYYQKNDSSGVWESPSSSGVFHNDSVQIWLSQIAALQNLAFSDFFDESHKSESFYASIQLRFQLQAEPLTLTFFHLRPLNVPEEMPAQKPDRRQLAPFVVHSSQNPTNYFAMADTTLLRHICQPF